MTISLPLHKKLALGVHATAEVDRPRGGTEGRGPGGGGQSDEGERFLGTRALRVGDLAKRTGKTVRALHLYEEHGLLAPAQRSSGGYRLYTRDSELRVRWIDKLQQMGFSLTDIKQIASEVERSKSAPDAMQRVQDLFREKLDDTREQLRRLSSPSSELTASLTYLETCDSCETEELLGACAACARHDCQHKTPDLVLGFRVH
jgi:MerR family transcriptional regulator, copper efflux regulator